MRSPVTGIVVLLGLFVAAIVGTTIPSDSRRAALVFATGLCERRCPDPGRTDGSLMFRPPLCTRAAPLTPPRSSTRLSPDCGALNVAFAVKPAARLSGCKSDEAAGFTLSCGPCAGSLRRGV